MIVQVAGALIKEIFVFRNSSKRNQIWSFLMNGQRGKILSPNHLKPRIICKSVDLEIDLESGVQVRVRN